MRQRQYAGILAWVLTLALLAPFCGAVPVRAAVADPEIPSGMTKIVQYGFSNGEDISALQWAEGENFDAGTAELAADGDRGVLRAEKTSARKESRLYQILSWPQTGSIVLEAAVKNPDGAAGDALQLRDEACKTAAMLRFTEDGRLVCLLADAQGRQIEVVLADGYSRTEWYQIELLLNTASKRVEVSLDGTRMGSGYFLENAVDISKVVLAAILENKVGAYLFDYLNLYGLPQAALDTKIDLDFTNAADAAHIDWQNGDGGTNAFSVDTANGWLAVTAPAGAAKKQLRYILEEPATEGIWNIEFRVRAEKDTAADIMHIRQSDFNAPAITFGYTNINSFLYKARKLLTNGVENIDLAAQNDGEWKDVKLILDLNTEMIHVYYNGRYHQSVYFREDLSNIGILLLAMIDPSAEKAQTVYFDYLRMYRVLSTNTAPVIDRVGFSDSPRATRNLMVDYEYQDAEGDAVFPSCKWYYSETEAGIYRQIPGESSRNLVCPWPCAGMYYKAELTLTDESGADSLPVMSDPIKDATILKEIKSYDFSKVTMAEFAEDWTIPAETANGTTVIKNGKLVMTANNSGGYAIKSRFDINAEMMLVEFTYSKDDVPDATHTMNTIDMEGYDGSANKAIAYTRATGNNYNAGFGNLSNGQETDSLAAPMQVKTPYRTRIAIDTKNKGNGEAAFFLDGEWKQLTTNKGEKLKPTLRNKVNYVSALTHQFAKNNNGSNSFEDYSVKQIIVPNQIEIAGAAQMNGAGTQTYTAVVKDIYARVQTENVPLVWSVTVAPGVSIDAKTGSLTVADTAKTGTYHVRATVEGDAGICAEYAVTVALPTLSGNWSFTLSDGTSPSDVAVSGGNAVLQLHNQGGALTGENAVLVLAEYDGDVLIRTLYQTISIAGLATPQEFSMVKLESEHPALRAFLWSDMRQIQPLWEPIDS